MTSWPNSASAGENETLNTSTSDSPILLNQLRRLGVFAAVIALFADQQKHAAKILGLRLQQRHRVVHGVQNRRPTIAGLQSLEIGIDPVAVVRVVLKQLRLGIEAHQRRPAARIGEKYVEQRAHLGEFVELQHAGAALLHGDNQRHGRRIHLLLHADLLRHAVIFKNEIARLQTVKNAAAALLHKCRHQHFGGCHAQIRGLALRDWHGLRRLGRRQLLRTNRAAQNSKQCGCEEGLFEMGGSHAEKQLQLSRIGDTSFYTRLRASRCISPVQTRKRRSSPREAQTKPRMLLAVSVSARRPE